jgi:hypothetical protein
MAKNVEERAHLAKHEGGGRGTHMAKNVGGGGVAHLTKDGGEARYHAHDLADGPQLHDVLELLVHVPQRESERTLLIGRKQQIAS